MPALDDILERAASRPATIVLPEGDDPRIDEAGRRAADSGIAKIILLKQDADTSPSENLSVMSPISSPMRAELARRLHQLRQHRGMTAEGAYEAATDPLIFAALLVQTGKADGTVGGAANATADVVRAALQVIGRAEDAPLVSSFFLMALEAPHHDPKKTVIFLRCRFGNRPIGGRPCCDCTAVRTIL